MINYLSLKTLFHDKQHGIINILIILLKITYQITTETCETCIWNMKHSKFILETSPCNITWYLKHMQRIHLTWETLLIQHM
jgi:hypothetical protein